MTAALSDDALKTRLIAACGTVVGNQERLTKADQAIGDGDHGVGMARGFGAARDALMNAQSLDAGGLLRTVGVAVLSKAGGASGAVFGTLFQGMAKAAGSGPLTAALLVAALREGLAAVQARGGAKPGDKTMLDALAPAIDAATGAESVEEAFNLAAVGAEAGARHTASMIARTGKAKSLGERSLGHVDPGALTLAIILAALAGREVPGS